MASIPVPLMPRKALLTRLLLILARGLAVMLAPLAVHMILARRSGIPLPLAQAAAALQVGAITWIVAGTVTGLTGWTRRLLAGMAMAAFLAAADVALKTSLVAVAALSHGVIYLGVGLLFGLSLRPGREALVSRLARRVEPDLTPALMAYTRGVTWLWAGFCGAQIAVSALLLAAAPLPVWSIFVNVLGGPLIGLTFAAEYAVRRWRFRHVRMASLAETVRAFRHRDAIGAASAPCVSSR